MRRIYITKKFSINEYHTTEELESVFDTFEKAERWIKRESNKNCTEKEYRSYRSQIVSLEMGLNESWESQLIWDYDNKGELIRHFNPSEDFESGDSFGENKPFEKKYKVGDLVLIQAAPWNKYSRFDVDVIGLIAYSPMKLEEWEKGGYDKDRWINFYTVDFLNKFGYMDHHHLPEIALLKFKGKLPKRISFLKTMKMHYLGKKKIQRKYLDKIFNSEILVEKTEIFSDKFFEKA